jgi:hypothetical protein
MTKHIVFCVTVLILAFRTYAGAFAAKHSVIIVSSRPDPTGVFPTSNLYLAELRTDEPITVEAIQMPGGYVGSGTFFHCSVEKWDKGLHRWRVIHQNDLSQFHNPNLTTLEIKSNEAREVCRALLPHDGGAKGDRARFRLSYTWHDFARSIVSDPFVIDGKDDAQYQRSGGRRRVPGAPHIPSFGMCGILGD